MFSSDLGMCLAVENETVNSFGLYFSLVLLDRFDRFFPLRALRSLCVICFNTLQGL